MHKETAICHWNAEAAEADPHIHTLSGTFRVNHCAITPDGERFVIIDSQTHLRIFDFQNYDEIYNLPLKQKLTSLSISQDSRLALVNQSDGQIQLIDIDSGQQVGLYEGFSQGRYMIRSAFGGAAENFVLSGSDGT